MNPEILVGVVKGTMKVFIALLALIIILDL